VEESLSVSVLNHARELVLQADGGLLLPGEEGQQVTFFFRDSGKSNSKRNIRTEAPSLG